MAHAINAERILRKTLNKIAHEYKYSDPDIEVAAVSTEGANYTSFLFAATISNKGQDLEGTEDKNALKLFAKVAAVGEKLRSQVPMRVFNIERIFYMELAKQYRELEEKHGIPEQHRFKYPKIYAIDPTTYEETVVMENLTYKGYALHDRLKSVEWEYAAAAFTEIAKMHALSMALKREKPKEFEHFADDFKYQADLFKAMGDLMKKMMEQGIQQTLEVTREEYKGRLMAFLGKMMAEGGMEMFMKYYQPGDTPVIRHGDYRPSNIMHKTNEDGSVDVVVLDFQLLLLGSPVVDLLFFIFLGTDQPFRALHYQRLMEHYYEELNSSLARLGLDSEELYSREKFQQDVKENLPYGLMISMATLALVMVDSAEAPSFSGDQGISGFLQMKTSSLYAERINGIFEDYIKWGIL